MLYSLSGLEKAGQLHLTDIRAFAAWGGLDGIGDPRFCAGDAGPVMAWAAERIGRRAYAMDVEPRYVDVAVRRWQAFTGKDAVDAESGRTFDQLAERAGAFGPACQGDHSETNDQRRQSE